MAAIITECDNARKCESHGLRGDEPATRSHNRPMKNPDKADLEAGNNLRAWRVYRQLTQQALADKIGTTASVIAMLEGGNRQLSPKWLRRLAPALGTTPGRLLELDPENLPTDILREWDDIPAPDRARALAVLQAFKRSA